MGITSFRVNFARGGDQRNLEMVAICREAAQAAGQEVMIMADLPGPKLRLGLFQNGAVELCTGEAYTIDRDSACLGDAHRAFVREEDLFRTARTGDHLDLCSGVSLQVVHKRETALNCLVVNAGKAYNRCGLAIRGRYVQNAGLTSVDERIFRKVREEVDCICPSFVDNPTPVDQLRLLSARGPAPLVIAKIESPIGVQNMDKVARISDGLMLCRGDLSRFFGPEEMQDLGLQLIRCTRKYRRIGMFATDYFRSMVDGGALTDDDQKALDAALQLRPEYLIVNETGYSRAWLNVARLASQMQSEWQVSVETQE